MGKCLRGCVKTNTLGHPFHKAQQGSLSIASITSHRVAHSFPLVIHAQVKAIAGAIASLDAFNPRLPGRFDSLVQQTNNFAIIKRLFRHRKIIV